MTNPKKEDDRAVEATLFSMPRTARLAGIAMALAGCRGNGDEARPPWPRSGPTPSGSRFVGRAIDEPAGGMRFAWSGSRVETRFVGPSLDVELEDDGVNAFEIVLDGKVLPPLRTSRGDRTYRIIDGAGIGEHDLVLSKRTEARAGEVVFRGFRTDPLGRFLKLGETPQRTLEVIGDSITAGMGNEGTEHPPTVKTHARMAETLLAALRSRLHWQ